MVFFPGSPTPVRLTPGAVSSTGDLAVLKIEDKEAVRGLPVLPLAKGSGTARRTSYCDRLSHGNCGNGGEVADRNLSAAGVPT